MKYKTMQEIETRKAAILQEMEQEGADLEALKKEMDELRENAAEIQKAAEKAAETRRQIANGAAGIVVESCGNETGKNNAEEVRASAEYAEAYKHYILTGKADECRALLSLNAAANGQVPVPTLVDSIIKTAWDNDELLQRVRKTYFRGNLKCPFERSADGAYVHAEGTTAVTEEDLTLGVVELKPETSRRASRFPMKPLPWAARTLCGTSMMR